MNETSSALPASAATIPDIVRSEDILVTAIWAVIGVFGIASNVLILIAILHNRRMSQATSYWFILSLSVCDICMLLVYFLLLVPATNLHDDFMNPQSPGNSLGIFIYDSFWYTGVFHLMLMAINRYINICQSCVYAQLFTARNTVILIIAALIAGVIVAVPGLFPCCRLVYDHYGYVAVYRPETTLYSYADILVNGVSVIVLVFCYVCIVIRVRQSRMAINYYNSFGLHRRSHTHTQQHCDGVPLEATRETLVQDSTSGNNGATMPGPAPVIRRRRKCRSTISRREMRLFFQFCSVSLIFLLTWSTWQWLPYMSNSKWTGFAVTTLFFINNCTNPTVYFIFNSTLRREIGDIFGLSQRKHRRPATPVSPPLEPIAAKALNQRTNSNLGLPRKSNTPSFSKRQSPFAMLLLNGGGDDVSGDAGREDDDSEDESSSETSSSAIPQPKEGRLVANIMVAQFSMPCAILGKAASNAGIPPKRSSAGEIV